MGGLVILITGIGAWLAVEGRSREDNNIRSELLRQASHVAATLSMESMRALSFRAEDTELPAYQRIAGQLQMYSQTMGLHRLYTLGLRDGQLVFGPGGQVGDSEYATPPGTIHQIPSDTDWEVFRTGEPRVAQLHSDEFGEFLSALVPIVDSLSGEVLLVVGLDMEASFWRKELQKAQQIPLWSALSIMGLLLLGYLLHEACKRSPDMRMEYLRNIQLSTYFAVMVLLTVIAFICVRDVEKKTEQELFKAEASAKSQYFTEATEQIDLVLHMLIGFFESSENITRKEFGSFCRHLFEGYPIQSCFWLPALSAADRPAFLAGMQAEFPDFIIRRSADGSPPDEGSPDPIYPAVFIEPASRLPTFLGYDFYSHPILRETMAETLRTGSDHACMVSAPVTDDKETAGFFVFAPITHTRQGGFVCFSIDLDTLIKGSTSPSDVRDISTTLFELSPGRKPQFLACSTCDQCEYIFEDDLSARAPLFAFGNTYMML
ncbi:MAG TPA: CHASE domain-containing protein, partial [Pontiella sp.]|nr:CHASE domain-containing protein [Pontiella sp.]